MPRSTKTNSATLCASLADLFTGGAVVATLREPGNVGDLLPEEAFFIGRSSPKRVQEFAAGRVCARRALAQFGVEDFPVRVAHDRRPLWPEQMIGSITHTAGFCAAVVAERKTLGAVGLDSETVGHVTPDLWPTICVPAESDWLASLPVGERAAAITLIFSAKEAFYKCQYPLTREWLDFHDLSIEVNHWGGSNWSGSQGQFSIRPTRHIAFAAHARLRVQGRYRFHEQFVSAGVALPG